MEIYGHGLWHNKITTPFSLDIYSGKTTDDYEIWVTPW